MKHFLPAVLLLVASVGGCREQPAGSQDSLDAIARDYVLLSLTIGEKEEGYIDAYYGPPEFQARAKAEAAGQSLEALAKRVADLSQRVADAGQRAEGIDQRRAKFLSCPADRRGHPPQDAAWRETVLRGGGARAVRRSAGAQAAGKL